MSELKRCEKCGGDNLVITGCVTCCDCLHQAPNVELWQLRPIEDELNAEIGRLRAELEARTGKYATIKIDEPPKRAKPLIYLEGDMEDDGDE